MSVSVVARRDWEDVYGVLKRSPEAKSPNSLAVLKRLLRISEEVWIGMHDEEVACVWGLAPPPPFPIVHTSGS